MPGVRWRTKVGGEELELFVAPRLGSVSKEWTAAVELLEHDAAVGVEGDFDGARLSLGWLYGERVVA